MKYAFLEETEVCYDILRQITIHTKHILNRNIFNNESELNRQNYILLELFETPNKLYTCENQISSLGYVFDSKMHAKRYINCDKGGDMFLTKGHLVPRNDVLYQFQQKTTSYDISTIPQ